MKKKLLSILLSIAVILTSTVTVFAEALPIGDSKTTWELTENNTILTIGGTGGMPDFAKLDDRPWKNDYDATITSVIVNPGVTFVGKGAFAMLANLANVTLPDSLEKIGDSAFASCTALQNITIPASVTEFSYKIFNKCEKLETIICNATNPPSLGSSAFGTCNALTKIQVPATSLEIYKAALGWRSYANIIEAIPVTIADILPIDFPTKIDTVPGNAWVNENGAKSYKYQVNNDYCLQIGNRPLEINSVLQKVGNNYKYGDNYTFVMEAGVLTNIIVEGVQYIGTNPNGTYYPPIIVAQIVNGDSYFSLSDALAAAQKDDKVKLLVDLDTTEDINVKEGTILDLNNHTINTTGNVSNNGTISLYNKNASIIDYLLYNVEGNYGAGEELKLPNSTNPKYIVPKGTFMTADVNAGNQTLEFAITDENDYLVWNEDVKKGTTLKVRYSLALGGDVVVPNGTSDITFVNTVNLKLNDDITIGSDNINSGGVLFMVFSIIDEEPAFSTKGSINPNSHKITLKENAQFAVSDDIVFDDSIIVSGITGRAVEKIYQESSKVYVYVLANEQKYENKPFELTEGNIKDLEFITTGTYEDEDDVTVKVDGKLVNPSNYTLAHGSTHVTLHKEFINTLAVGKHTMTVGIDGYNTISQDFYIKAKPSPTPYIPPKTGVE